MLLFVGFIIFCDLVLKLFMIEVNNLGLIEPSVRHG